MRRKRRNPSNTGRPTREFEGELAQAIRGKRLKWSPAAEELVGGLTEAQVAAANRIERQREIGQAVKKLNLLFEHFGIARTGNPAADYWCLSLWLAMEFVPGFQVVIDDAGPRRGRRRVREPFTLTRLLLDLDAVKRGADVTNREALKTLKAQGGRWRTYTVPTLTGWLHEARNSKKNPLLRSYEHVRSTGQVQALSDFLDDCLRQFGE